MRSSAFRSRVATFAFLVAFLGAIGALSEAPCSAGVIAGRVVDASAQPVANARVVAADSTVGQIVYSTPEFVFASSLSEDDRVLGTAGHLTGEVRTDARGRFSIPDLRASRYTVLAADGKKGCAVRLDVPADEGASTIELALQMGGTLEGGFSSFHMDDKRHVLELKLRTPVANVTFVPKLEYLPGDRFRFTQMPAIGAWNLVMSEWVMERGYRGTLLTLPVQCPPGVVTKLDVDFAHGETITGAVSAASGGALPYVSVVARSSSAPFVERGCVTDERGHYTLRGLEAGAWTVEARRWTVRSSAGCGLGPKDVFTAREVTLPRADSKPLDLTIEKTQATLRVGDTAPDFSATCLDGRTISLVDLRGKVVIVDFWATWCGMCRSEFPRLRETYALFGGGKELEIVGASIDEDPDVARRLTQRLQLGWPQTALGPVEKNALAQLFNVASTPSCFVIDREGKIVAINVAGEELRAELAKLLRSTH
jgi:peroxiredoxin